MSNATPQPVAVPSAAAAKKKSRTRLYLILGSVLLLGALIAAGIAKGRSEEKPIQVTTEKAFVKNITQVVTATGRSSPRPR